MSKKTLKRLTAWRQIVIVQYARQHGAIVDNDGTLVFARSRTLLCVGPGDVKQARR